MEQKNIERLELIKRNCVEIVTENELRELITNQSSPIVYCGYELSGKIHLGHLVTITKLIDFMKSGFKVKVLFADWHTWLNRKGDWDYIKEELNEWKRKFRILGLRGDNVDYVSGSYFQKKIEYIEDVFKLSLNITLKRALRSMQQIARDIENARVSQVIYPLMQVADIKHLKADVAYGGIEQRKIHMLAREHLKTIGYKPPICVHTPLISSLSGKGKMSSSDKDSMITIDDKEDEIKSKIKKAYCPEGITENNPILDIVKLIIIPRVKELEIKRDAKYGGNIIYNNYEQLERDYSNKKLHPQDLKNSVSSYLIDILNKIKENN